MQYIINAPETDHSAITLYLKTEDLLQPKAPGFWKFNNPLLDDENFTSAIRESLPVFKDKYADLDDLGLKWDLIKMEIRAFTIKFSKIKAKNKKNKEAAFEDLLNDNLKFLALSEMKEKYNFEFPFTTYYGLLR